MHGGGWLTFRSMTLVLFQLLHLSAAQRFTCIKDFVAPPFWRLSWGRLARTLRGQHTESRQDAGAANNIDAFRFQFEFQAETGLRDRG